MLYSQLPHDYEDRFLFLILSRIISIPINGINTSFCSVRIHEESVKAFDTSLDTCEKALNELDEESLQKFSSVGSTISEVREQLDNIQVGKSVQ